MSDANTQSVDLLISHSQILVRSKEFDEKLSHWGKGNISQGAILHMDYIIFDPLPEDSFGANVYLKLSKKFIKDENSQRCIVAPFFVTDKDKLEVASASEKFKITLNLENTLYSVYYEVCEGDEIYYNFTFIPASEEIAPQYLIDDPWGGVKNKKLNIGVF